MTPQIGMWRGMAYDCYVLHYIKDYISEDGCTVYGINQCSVYPKITGTTPCCVLDGNQYTPAYGEHWISFYDSHGSGPIGNVIVEYTIVDHTTVNIWVLSYAHDFYHRIYWNDELLWGGVHPGTPGVLYLGYSGTVSITCPEISYNVIAKYMTTNGYRSSDSCIFLMAVGKYAYYTTHYPYNYVVFKTCHSDSNDGRAYIYINGVLTDVVDTYNVGTTYYGPYPLPDAPITVRVECRDFDEHVHAGSFIFFNDEDFDYTIY